MSSLILQALGGVGLLLLGMVMLTDGMHSLAGSALRRFLRRSTRSPASGAVAGALATGIIQSSSATTVAAVGFVGAGLITFNQALGIIFGANIGTTVTGWLIAILGFKLQLGTVMTPFVLIGAFLRLFGPGRWRHAGWALAGFSLLFIGISLMQQGMSSLQGMVNLQSMPVDTPLGRLELVAVGIAITVVTQSSTAGVAAALVALQTGAVNFEQAAAMVVGMNVGTTVTTVLASVGGSTPMRRTAYAHVIYNVMTGVVVLAVLGPMTAIVAHVTAQLKIGDPQIDLVAFHTAFNVLGTLILLPFTARFARLVIRLVPERGPRLTARLDEQMLTHPAVAADATAATVDDITHYIFEVLADQLDAVARPAGIERRLSIVEAAVDETREFVDRVRTDPTQRIANQRHVAAIHALDHLGRLLDRCRENERVITILYDEGLKPFGVEIAGELRSVLEKGSTEEAETRLNLLRKKLRDKREEVRESTIVMATSGTLGTYDAIARLDAIRWLHRVSYHLWRIVHHQRMAQNDVHPEQLVSAVPREMPD